MKCKHDVIIQKSARLSTGLKALVELFTSD